MTKKERAALCVEALKKEYPDALCSLEASDPLQLLIATRLSAQCTDARVNLVTPALFEKYPTLDAFCEAEIADVEELIHSCGFFRAKARDIVGMAKKIIAPEESNNFCHRMVLHGRAVCIARRPQCENCCIRAYCKSAK